MIVEIISEATAGSIKYKIDSIVSQGGIISQVLVVKNDALIIYEEKLNEVFTRYVPK